MSQHLKNGRIKQFALLEEVSIACCVGNYAVLSYSICRMKTGGGIVQQSDNKSSFQRITEGPLC